MNGKLIEQLRKLTKQVVIYSFPTLSLFGSECFHNVYILLFPLAGAGSPTGQR